MRGKIVTFTMLVVSFLGGSLLMYYLLKNNEPTTQIINNQDSKTGIVKCSNEIKIDDIKYTKRLNYKKAKQIIKELDLSNKSIVIIEPK